MRHLIFGRLSMPVQVAVYYFYMFLVVGLSSPAHAALNLTRNCTDPPTGLTAWWGGDGNVADVFGHFNGTLVGDTGFTGGLAGEAFSFEGDSDRVDIVGSPIGDFGAAAFSVSFWMKTNTVGGGTDAFIIGRSNPDAGQGWDIRRTGASIRVVGVNGWGFNISSGSVLSLDTWHHVVLAGAADGSSSDNVVLYVDGDVAGTSERANISSTSNPFRFGMSTNFGGIAFDGAMDEIQVFDRAIAIDEVQSIFVAGANGTCRPCMALPPKLLSWWRGEDNALDQTGSHTGIPTNGIAFADGKVGRAFSLDGSNDHVLLPDDDDWDFGVGSFSINAWFKTGTIGRFRNIIRYHDGGGSSGFWGVRMNPAGQVELIMADQAGVSTILSLTSSVVFADDNWHLVSAVRDAAAGELRLYVDGNSAATPISDGAANVVGSVTARAAIGALAYPNGSSDELFSGLIDEVMILREALTLNQLQAIYNAQSAGHCSACTMAPAGQISWWRGEGNASDELGVNPAVAVNNAGYSVGLVGQAFNFEGNNDYMEVADDASIRFEVDQPMSIELWAYRTGPDAAQHLIGKRSGAGAEEFNYQVLQHYGGELCFGADGASLICTSGADDLPLNTWTHIAGTFDGITKHLYINGREVVAAVGSLGTPDSATLKIGSSGLVGDFNQDFDGLIDEVEIRNRALSKDEVYAVYSAGSSGKCRIDQIYADGFEALQTVHGQPIQLE